MRTIQIYETFDRGEPYRWTHVGEFETKQPLVNIPPTQLLAQVEARGRLAQDLIHTVNSSDVSGLAQKSRDVVGFVDGRGDERFLFLESRV